MRIQAAKMWIEANELQKEVTKMTSFNVEAIKLFAVKDATGKIDYMQSLERYLGALKSMESLLAADELAIATACSLVFDRYRGVNVTDVGWFILRELNPSPDNHSELSRRVQEYLKENTGEQGEKLFGSQRGKGGGTWRWSDRLQKREITPEPVVEAVIKKDKKKKK